MKKVCAWCGKYLGTKRPIKNNHITHCICKPCKEKELDKITSNKSGDAPLGREGQPSHECGGKRRQTIVKIGQE